MGHAGLAQADHMTAMGRIATIGYEQATQASVIERLRSPTHYGVARCGLKRV